jgi:hypothetical protein
MFVLPENDITELSELFSRLVEICGRSRRESTGLESHHSRDSPEFGLINILSDITYKLGNSTTSYSKHQFLQHRKTKQINAL